MKQIQFFWIGRWEPELNQILSMISNRNSENSCNKNHFDKAAPDYHIHRCSFRYKPREENTELSIEREAIPPPPPPTHTHPAGSLFLKSYFDRDAFLEIPQDIQNFFWARHSQNLIESPERY